MKRVAVILTASLALILAACAVEKPVEVSASRAEVKEGEVSSNDDVGSNRRDEIAAPAGVSPVSVAMSDTAKNEQAAVESAPEGAAQAVTVKNGVSDESVRDAKEAAEEAARKIVDATLEAANMIKEVGLGAVQSVRESANRSNSETGSEELAAKDERVD